jgi:hypothetical protein
MIALVEQPDVMEAFVQAQMDRLYHIKQNAAWPYQSGNEDGKGGKWQEEE